MTLDSVNPATGELIASYPEMSDSEVSAIVESSATVAKGWSAASFEDRARVVDAAADLLRKRADSLALLMADEMGKPVSQGVAEVGKCAWVCAYYAEQAEAFLAPQPVATEAARSFWTYLPLGTVLAVMPWNFPLWQVFRFAAPALMAGNVALLKHAANVTGCALAIQAILTEAGLPPGAFASLLIDSSRVERVIGHPVVRAVTLTGSTRAGRSVAAAAGRHLKKTVLELGGSDPYIILEDADLDAAAEVCAASRLINTGQSCIAAKRFIVVGPRVDEFADSLAARMQSRQLGPPREDPDLGPLARRDLRDELHSQVLESIRLGARRVTGGDVPDGPGAYYPPTVLADVAPGMPAFDEETFGPVAAVVAASDEAEALRLANRSPYGLGAAVFTRDLDRGEAIATAELDAGACFVNALVRSDPRLPFGGVKDSGYGRELSPLGIREFVNAKTVWVESPD